MKQIKSIRELEEQECSIDEKVMVIENYSGESENKLYGKINDLIITTEGVTEENKVIYNIIMPSRDELEKCKKIQFKECIFLEEFNFKLSEFNAPIIFNNCIFIKDVSLFGNFNNVVSFEGSTFINSTVNFQDCRFEHFVLKLSTFTDCFVCFQETEFYSNNVFLNNISINETEIFFNNSFFSKNADLFDLSWLKADQKSKIIFRMVDFSFGEVRLFGSDIEHLEFIDCTFECNRFDFDCNCKTLIMQECKNFRIITLSNLKQLKNLNILNLINTGKILVTQEANYYINAIKTNKNIIWVKGYEYKKPENSEYKKQLFILMNFYDLSQKDSANMIQNEIDLINKAEEIKRYPYEKTKIFLSYSWKDEQVADSIEQKFTTSGMTLVRDKHDMHYKSSIKEFMKQIRGVDFALIIISESYLMSSNCMYEITEFTKNTNYKDRILPVIKRDADIFTITGRNKYIIYWQDKYQELENNTRKLEELNRVESIKELIRYERIKRDLPDFLSNIADMNSITCDELITDIDFEKIWMIVTGQV